MSIKNTPQIILISAILTGCVNTIDTTDLEVVPSNETLMSLETDNIQQIQDKRTEYRFLKLQPANKTEKCEIAYMTNEGDLSVQNGQFFWDGNCIKGKADGIGRLFVKYETTDSEQIVEYSDNQTLINIYLINDKKNGTLYKGQAEIDLDEKTQFGYFRSVTPKKTKYGELITDILETRDVTYIYRYNHDNSFEEYTKSYCALQNDNEICFNITTQVKPDLERISFSNTVNNGKAKEIGYVHESNPANPDEKAVKLITEKGTVTTKNAEFPLEYLTYIREINNEIKNRVSYVPESVALSENKIEEYKNKACAVTSVDFMPLDDYLKICN